MIAFALCGRALLLSIAIVLDLYDNSCRSMLMNLIQTKESKDEQPKADNINRRQFRYQ